MKAGCVSGLISAAFFSLLGAWVGYFTVAGTPDAAVIGALIGMFGGWMNWVTMSLWDR